MNTRDNLNCYDSTVPDFLVRKIFKKYELTSEEQDTVEQLMENHCIKRI